MNDRWTYKDSKNNSNVLQLSLEGILRLASHHGVAAVPMSVFMGQETAVEEVYHRLCSHYRVPMLSYRTVVIDEVRQAFQLKEFNSTFHVHDSFHPPVLFCAAGIEDLHPRFQTHFVIAQFVCDFLEKAYLFYMHESRSAELAQVLQRWPVGGKDGKSKAVEVVKPLFGYGIDEHGGMADDRLACHPIQTFYSSLPSDDQFVTSHSFSEPLEVSGWEFKVDYPGKPEGWVSEGEGKNAYGKLVLKVVSGTGKVTVSYLKSYRNSGKFEFYFRTLYKMQLSVTDPKRRIAHPDMIACCHNHRQSLSGYVDTYDNSSTTSVIVSRTFHFDVVGLVHFVVQRVALSGEEVDRRGGDKVKIVSIRTC
jgi:hypothetical protein